jgi:hypothetical protein
MAGLHVTPEELIANAKVLDGDVHSLRTESTKVHDCLVPAGAFGRIPGIGPHIDGLYVKHVNDSSEVLQKATDGLDDITKSLNATAESFLEMEKQMAGDLHKVDYS